MQIFNNQKTLTFYGNYNEEWLRLMMVVSTHVTSRNVSGLDDWVGCCELHDFLFIYLNPQSTVITLK